MKEEKEIKIKLSTAITGILVLIIIVLGIGLAILYKQNMEKANPQEGTTPTSSTANTVTQQTAQPEVKPQVTTLSQEEVKIRKFLTGEDMISTARGVGGYIPSTYYFRSDGRVAYLKQDEPITKSGETTSFVGTWKCENNRITINIEQEKKAVGGKKAKDEIIGEYIEGYKEELSKKSHVIEFNVKGFKKEKDESSYPYEYIESDKGNLYKLQLETIPEESVKAVKDLAENGYKDNTNNTGTNTNKTNNLKTTVNKYKEITKKLDDDEIFSYEKYEKNNGNYILIGKIKKRFVMTKDELEKAVKKGTYTYKDPFSDKSNATRKYIVKKDYKEDDNNIKEDYVFLYDFKGETRQAYHAVKKDSKSYYIENYTEYSEEWIETDEYRQITVSSDTKCRYSVDSYDEKTSTVEKVFTKKLYSDGNFRFEFKNGKCTLIYEIVTGN